MMSNDSFFFFLISNNDIYSRTLPYAEKHKAERKIQREGKREKKDSSLNCVSSFFFFFVRLNGVAS